VNGITRTEAIQWDLGIGDALAWSGWIHCWASEPRKNRRQERV